MVMQNPALLQPAISAEKTMFSLVSNSLSVEFSK